MALARVSAQEKRGISMTDKLLIIDDKQGTCLAIAQALLEEGFCTVRTTESSPTALSMLLVQPDLIILAAQVSLRKGCLVLQHYQALPSPVPPVIVVSALPDIERALSVFLIPYSLVNPQNIQQLLRCVRRYLSPRT
jgi:DNA-binding response OmpR family regulator